MVFGFFSTAESITKDAQRAIELSNELDAYYAPKLARAREIYDSIPTLTQEQAQALLPEIAELQKQIQQRTPEVDVKSGELVVLRNKINRNVSNASESVKASLQSSGIITDFTKAWDRQNSTNNKALRVAFTTDIKLKEVASGKVPDSTAAAQPTAKQDTSGQTPAKKENTVSDDSSTTVVDKVSDAKKLAQELDRIDAPGRRLENPLSRYSSYTYNISLYMITPTAYESFLATGRKNISQLAGGVYVVAQSGGVDDDATIKRPPGFEFDYWIDNLKIKTTTGGKSTSMDSNVTSIDFNIIEPNGFSLISKLTRASKEIQSQTFVDPADKSKPNAARQFFILQIRFTGYDSDGNVVKDEDIIERYYDIYIVSIKFKIDGKHTTYTIKAASLQPSRGLGNMNGRINSSIEVVGTTVEDVLKGNASSGSSTYSLVQKLNQDQITWANQKGYLPMEYDVEFFGPGSDDIKNAKLLLPGEYDKFSWAAADPAIVQRTTNSLDESSKIAESNVANKRAVRFVNGISIIQAISNVISRSTYLSDVMTQIYDSNTFNNSNSTSNQNTAWGTPIGQKPPTRPLRWFNLTTRLSNIRYDPKRRDYVYKITYVIQVYETPNVISSFAGLVSSYYGPHKRYEYWFTGKNSEIISYEQTLDNAWYVADYAPGEGVNSGGSTLQLPAAPGQMQTIDKTAKMGLGMQAQASYLNNLYAPGSYVMARVRILGDPDFLMQDSPSGINQVYQQFYGSDGFTVNPNGGQVFIEIDFNEAIDYDYEDNDGLMSINDSILFWAYPPEVRERVKGNSYQVLSVESDFSRGAFFQQVNAVINPLTNLIKELENKRSDGREIQVNQQARGRSDDFFGIEDDVPQPATATNIPLPDSNSPDYVKPVYPGDQSPDFGRESANVNLQPGSGA